MSSYADGAKARREVEEGQQGLTVFRQAADGIGISGRVFVDEDGDRGLGSRRSGASRISLRSAYRAFCGMRRRN